MSRWGTVASVSQTAWQECALLGHREVDVEHVLLAALDDQQVAQVLARHGVTREGTRAQVEGLVREQLASIGVDLGEAVHTSRRATDELHHEAVGNLAISRRAQDLIGRARSAPQVVLAVLDSPDGTGADLFRRQGADLLALRADLAALLPAQEPGSRATVVPAAAGAAALPGSGLIAGSPGQSRASGRFFPVPWEQVWPHVATAAGARAWMLSDETTEVSGPAELSGQIRTRRGRTRGGYVRRLLEAAPPSESSPGHVLWQEEWQLAGRGRSGPGQWTHLTLTPSAGGTKVDLVIGVVRHGRLQPLLRPLISLGQAIASRNALYHLGLVIEDAGPSGASRQGSAPQRGA